MRKIIHKIRSQPPQFRVMVAVIAALVVTAGIAVLWAFSFSKGPVDETSTVAPSPLSALVDTVKNTIQDSKEDHANAGDATNPVQVINADDATASQ